ncbi:seipin [Ischnura elegans]|uniref:seipin n=1 Tax=Ischnura elegans TaxID=197161 RepID=UPI001ED889F1|nr:seipin [Ischnura elegans]
MAGFLGRIIDYYISRLVDRAVGVKNVFFNGGMVVVIGMISIWMSIFLYVAFYYAYMPAVLHVRPVHLQFKPCEEEKGICSFPSAHIQLTKKQQLLMIGQPYKMYLHMEMPESPANQKLGMFMVCAHLEDKGGTLVNNACRAAMIHYRSHLLHTLYTLIFFPFLVFGSAEEKQTVVVELYSGFEEDPVHPVTDIYVEVQSRHIEIYSAELRVTAHLTGLRHLMFHWPTFSAGVGVVSILFFLAVLIALSWCHHTLKSDFVSNVTGKAYGQEKDWVSGDEESEDDDDDDETKDSQKLDTAFTGEIDDDVLEGESSEHGQKATRKKDSSLEESVETLK